MKQHHAIYPELEYLIITPTGIIDLTMNADDDTVAGCVDVPVPDGPTTLIDGAKRVMEISESIY